MRTFRLPGVVLALVLFAVLGDVLGAEPNRRSADADARAALAFAETKTPPAGPIAHRFGAHVKEHHDGSISWVAADGFTYSYDAATIARFGDAAIRDVVANGYRVPVQNSAPAGFGGACANGPCGVAGPANSSCAGGQCGSSGSTYRGWFGRRR